MNDWVKTVHIDDVPPESGVAVKCGDAQVAVFNFTSKGEWHATQNLCPHRQQMALGRGMLGDKEGISKVACPFHKKTFSLSDGHCLADEELHIDVYPVKVENDYVYVQLAQN